MIQSLRIPLLFSFLFLCLWTYQAWLEDHPHPAVTPSAHPTGVVETPPPARITDNPAPTLKPDVNTPPALLESASLMPPSASVRVVTDVIDTEIALRGGVLQSLNLLGYPETSGQAGSAPFRIFTADALRYYQAQLGLVTTLGAKAPSHETLFESAKQEYRLGEDQADLAMELIAHTPEGLEVVNQYRFFRGSYQIEIRQIVRNRTAEPWSGRAYQQLVRTAPKEEGYQFVYTYTGASFYTPAKKYEKLPFDKYAKQPLDQEVTGGWIAMDQHYFLSAWIPPATIPHHLYSHQLEGPRYRIGMYSPSIRLSPGEETRFETRLLAGPKLQEELGKVAPGLEFTVDYGNLTILSQPLFWLLSKLHVLIDNWGVAIILLTLLIKAAFYKLSEASYKSMANMRKITPRLQALKDRYGDDRERLNQAMMEMYKKEKINPLGGCLPIVVQVPVFIALYWVLLESVELRDAPFFLWIHSLSVKDPYFVLPLVMGASMWVQQMLNPAPIDPVQAKVMMLMPILFTVFFAFFPAGLVLYWVVNNLLSIAQQWHITRKISPETL
ncbi:Membrane protein insertase YidC [Gammaproteobacteria bacterium]